MKPILRITIWGAPPAAERFSKPGRFSNLGAVADHPVHALAIAWSTVVIS